jgi:hypothetical protein
MLMMSEPDLYKEISNLNETIYQNPAMFAKYEYIIADNEREADLN